VDRLRSGVETFLGEMLAQRDDLVFERISDLRR